MLSKFNILLRTVIYFLSSAALLYIGVTQEMGESIVPNFIVMLIALVFFWQSLDFLHLVDKLNK